MRKELYNMLCKELKEVGGGLIKHIDLWNHNVEFIEQEENWERPAVFVEFCPIRWNAIVDGGGISGRTGSETAYRDGLGRCSQRGQSVQGRGVGGV